MEQVPYTIIGGGVCGILTALKLKQKFASAEVVLVEKEPYVGHHNTSRNSGVLHAGIYYQSGSLKQRACMSGYEHWLSISAQLKIPINICGKYIIATQNAELEALQNIYANGKNNKVSGLREMTSKDFTEIGDYCKPIAGFFSTKSGILDISSAINILRDEFVKIGGIILLNTEAIKIHSAENKIQIETKSDKFVTGALFNCAGLDAVSLRKQLGLTDIENYFVKGNYLKLNKPYYNKKLIYPVPDKNLHGLGVHTSFHMDGIVRFGPNTENTTEPNYINSSENVSKMFPAITEKFKNIRTQDLSPDYTGVRTKILRGGKLYSDFLIQTPVETRVPGYFEMLGIESPGMTAAPALADAITSQI